ncbi:unnamed protein product [Ilex paraguariensis]|uniref:EDR1/CTR1/ARMC3-like peptidase-like domain-containing protein n=1 Tax=Ilex paraguariensis TaxID=185542 RepID=A0ABC8SA35_9AQUA
MCAGNIYIAIYFCLQQVTGCLSYYDKVRDGFYLIHGMDPYVWTISTDLHETGRVPSFELLKAVNPCNDFPIEVVLVDKSRDPSLRELLNKVLGLYSSWTTQKEVVDHLAELVCKRLGGIASTGEDCLENRWKERVQVLKDCLGSIVIPIGRLSVGSCVHRALLFKVLADIVNLPCRIAKGCKYCGRECASSCLVRFGLDRSDALCGTVLGYIHKKKLNILEIQAVPWHYRMVSDDTM